MEQTVKYPIGVQTFENLRRQGYVYIDKTALVYKLVDTGNYYFLSRPRRFGKSMLISTLEAYFLGKKELFKGLAIEQLETEWTTRPVLHVDLNIDKYDTVQDLLDLLNDHLSGWEATYGTSPSETNIALRFAGVIRRACEKTGERVAILIDEYDKPLLKTFGDKALQEQMRATLRSFYSVLKSQDENIRFALLTGVTKFGKLSVFSDLNSPDDISLSLEWATLCGITEQELRDNLTVGIGDLAQANGLTRDEALSRLKHRYDGYHFHPKAPGGYNPYSVLKAMRHKEFGSYWFETGTPSFLVKLLQQAHYNLNRLSGERQTADKLNSIDDAETSPVPMLYQSGYLTIKGFDERFRYYQLGFPNAEVEEGFVSYLLPCYITTRREESDFNVANFVEEVETGNAEGFLRRLQAMLADNSYTVQGDRELYFQNVMYVIFKMMGFYVDVERTTSRGRIDMVIKTKDYIYVIEIKYDGSAQEALKQIEDKGYADPYATDPRKLYRIGVNFSSETRTITGWQIAE